MVIEERRRRAGGRVIREQVQYNCWYVDINATIIKSAFQRGPAGACRPTAQGTLLASQPSCGLLSCLSSRNFPLFFFLYLFINQVRLVKSRVFFCKNCLAARWRQRVHQGYTGLLPEGSVLHAYRISGFCVKPPPVTHFESSTTFLGPDFVRDDTLPYLTVTRIIVCVCVFACACVFVVFSVQRECNTNT